MQIKGKRILVCNCEISMPLDGKALAKACGAGGRMRGAHAALPGADRKLQVGGRERRAAARRLHPGGAAVRGDPGRARPRDRDRLHQHPRARRLGRAGQGRAAQDRGAARRSHARSAADHHHDHALGRRMPGLRPGRGGDRGGKAAGAQAVRDRDPHPAEGRDPAAADRRADLRRHDRARLRPPRRLRADGRRLRPDVGVVAPVARFRAGQGRGRRPLRSDPRSVRGRAAVPGPRQARRLFQAGSRQPRSDPARAVRSDRSGRRVREAALRRLQGRAVRPFAQSAGSAAPAVWRCARRRRSSPAATWSRSTPTSAAAAAPATASAPRAPPATPIRRPPRSWSGCARCFRPIGRRAARDPCSWSTTRRTAAS